MNGRDSGGPIRRRAGERKRTDADVAAPGSGAPDSPASPAEPRPERVLSSPGAGATKRPAGRRVFDPTGGRSVSAPPPSGKQRKAAGAAAKSGSAAKGGAKDGAKGSADVDEQERANALAAEKGIPPVHALRVLRGETTLNEVLKALMRKERARRLVDKEGLDPGLAGQVASGHLSRERALLVQRIRKHRPHRIDRDALKLAEVAKAPIAFQTFDNPWVVGEVSEARTYEFDVRVAGASEGGAVTVQKHDVKLVAQPDQVAGIEAGREVDAEVAAEHLAGTADRGSRVRPEDSALIELVESGAVVRCVLRDGQLLVGRIVSFGRWDFDLELGGGAQLTVMFHAVHPASRWK